jgi:retinol dehydrogenase-13
VALVTGATGAIGEAIACGLAAEPHTRVIITARDERKARQTIERIARTTRGSDLGYEIVDLGRQRSVQDLARRWRGPLHVLVNNAAIAPRRREETPDGLERQFATNIMGYFWMMKLFAEVLVESRPARVVNVASYWAGGLVVDDLQFRRRPYDNDDAYRQAKQADRMLTVAFASRFEGRGVTVNACHPGDVRSTLSSSLGFGGHETPAQAATTPLWLATSSAGADANGKYFEHQRLKNCAFGQDRAVVERLFTLCDSVAAL